MGERRSVNMTALPENFFDKLKEAVDRVKNREADIIHLTLLIPQKEVKPCHKQKSLWWT